MGWSVSDGSEGEGIDAGAVYRQAPVQMRASDAAAGADPPDYRAWFDQVAGLYVDLGEVTVEGVDAKAVIDQHGVAGEVQFFGENHAAALAGVNRNTGERGNVHAGVRRTWLAVQDAAPAEVLARRGAVDGNAKLSLPQFFGSNGGVEFAKFLAV